MSQLRAIKRTDQQQQNRKITKRSKITPARIREKMQFQIELRLLTSRAVDNGNEGARGEKPSLSSSRAIILKRELYQKKNNSLQTGLDARPNSR